MAVKMKTRKLNLVSVITGFRDEFITRFDRIDKKLEAHDENFEVINKKFDGIDKKFENNDRKFDSIDKKFENNDMKFDSIDKRFDAVDKRFTLLENKIDANTADIISGQEKIGATLDAMSVIMQKVQIIDHHENRITAVEREQKVMKVAIKNLKSI